MAVVADLSRCDTVYDTTHRLGGIPQAPRASRRCRIGVCAGVATARQLLGLCVYALGGKFAAYDVAAVSRLKVPDCSNELFPGGFFITALVLLPVCLFCISLPVKTVCAAIG